MIPLSVMKKAIKNGLENDRIVLHFQFTFYIELFLDNFSFQSVIDLLMSRR